MKKKSMKSIVREVGETINAATETDELLRWASITVKQGRFKIDDIADILKFSRSVIVKHLQIMEYMLKSELSAAKRKKVISRTARTYNIVPFQVSHQGRADSVNSNLEKNSLQNNTQNLTHEIESAREAIESLCVLSGDIGRGIIDIPRILAGIRLFRGAIKIHLVILNKMSDREQLKGKTAKATLTTASSSKVLHIDIAKKRLREVLQVKGGSSC